MNKSAVFLSIISICFALIVAFAGYKLSFSPTGKETALLSWTHEDQRVLANRLKGAGLTVQAIREYEQYVKTSPLDRKQVANISYTIGKMHMETGQYEKALSWFYRVEIADAQTQLKSEVNSKIISCLERSGKYGAAEYSLSRSTSHENEGVRKTGKVAAKIGDEKIYLEDINEVIDSMPKWMRKQFEDKKARVEFLKKYVADELLYRKAVKLELNKAPDIRKKLRQMEKELMVNKILEQELKDKIKIENDDLENYFKAHKQDYIEKEAVRLSLIKAGMKEISGKIIEKLKNGKDFSVLAREISLDDKTAKNGGRFSGWVRKGEDDLGIGSVDALAEVLFSAKQGSITPAIEAGGYYYIFRIDDKRPQKIPLFKECEKQVKNDYFMQKMDVYYRDLIGQILKTSDVKFYPEVVAGEGSL